MNQEQFQELLRKYREGRCTSEEEKIVDDWYTSISTPEEAFSNGVDEARTKKETWDAVDEYIGKLPRGRGKVVRMRTWSFVGVAAAVALVLAIVVFRDAKIRHNPGLSDAASASRSASKLVSNDGNKPLDFSLPDGTNISLLPGSHIRYAASFDAVKREVFLDGAAFFKVSRNIHRPFFVYTNQITTEVLGTSFLVRAYKEQKEIVVTVKTGKVSVYTNPTSEEASDTPYQKVILTPNQQVIYNADEKVALRKLVDKPEPVAAPTAPRNSYTNKSVVNILSSLERNYGIDIQYDSIALANCTLTSDMSAEGFYQQIKILCNALGAQYTLSDSAVIINARGCNAR